MLMLKCKKIEIISITKQHYHYQHLEANHFYLLRSSTALPQGSSELEAWAPGQGLWLGTSVGQFVRVKGGCTAVKPSPR